MIDNVLLPNVQSTPNVSSTNRAATQPGKKEEVGKSFEAYLNDAEKVEKSNDLKFSSHALSRLQSRNIMLSPTDIQRINTAAEKAAAKGGKDTLVLMNGSGFIVDTKSKTVVTAMDLNSMKDHVFTNIDTAVVG